MLYEAKKPLRKHWLSVDTEIITKMDEEDLQVRDGNVVASPDKDVWKVAAFDRTYGTEKNCGISEKFWC